MQNMNKLITKWITSKNKKRNMPTFRENFKDKYNEDSSLEKTLHGKNQRQECHSLKKLIYSHRVICIQCSRVIFIRDDDLIF